jgi:hypothetical protein
MTNVSRPPRGQQRDKPYREALRMELAAAGENMMALREIAKVHIAKCMEGDIRAIKELGDRLDGRPAQSLDLSDDSNPRLTKIIHEFVHVTETRDDISLLDDSSASDEPAAIEWRGVRDANGSGGLNEDTARTKR